jgi:FlaA1/EpsC-like NDP-sugar epimerase
LANLCLEYNVTPLIVPPVENWINNKLHIQDIKHIKIEDLLHRDPIRLHLEKIKSELAGKVILVTGAAGSIGSEMVRQIINFEPHKLVVLDQAESPLVDLELEILENHPYANLYPVVADICDSVNLDRIFQEHRPQVVFHAAAYKHVPMMERHPEQAVKVNVLGTKNVADMSVAYKAEKFVMISTDKAVNPTNVMGASKRIAEIYIQALNDAISNSVTRFVTTRFGNVLGSNGSVVPRFKKQIEEGGPITVTHPDITRYFMTIPEACQLVLEAGTMGKGGEVFLFDMGEPVKIIDLAKKMIKLYGLKPYKDIKIEFTGLRPGEKLYEELLNNKENTLPTHHPKIMIAKVSTSSYDHVSSQFGQLVRALDQNDDFLLVEKMKQMVPEFISNCSKYEALDKQDAKAV